MPTVPISTGPTVENRPAPFVPQNTQFDPNAFGAGIGQAAQGVGKALGTDADEATKVATNLAIDASTRAAKTSDTAHQQTVTALGYTNLPGGPDGNKGYFSLSGQAAVDAKPIYDKAIADSNTSISDGLSSDPRAQNMYQSQAGMRIAAEGQKAAMFANAQGKIADVGASTARMGAYADSFTNNYNQPDALKNFNQVTAGENQTQAKLLGWGPDEAAENLKKVQSKGYSDAIRAATAQGDVSTGAALFKQLSPSMDAATRVSLAQHLEPLVTNQMAGQLVKAALGNAGGTTGGSTPANAPGGIADAIHGNESNGSATSPTSVDGARGGWQVIPATFNRFAQPGESIDNPADNERVARRYIDHLSDVAGGDPARIAVGYFSGEGNIAPAGSATPWLEDRHDGNGSSTSGYVSAALRRMGTGPSAPTGTQADANPNAPAPEWDTIQSKLLAQTEGNDKLQRETLSKLSQARSQWELQTQGARDALMKGDGSGAIADKMAALAAGNTSIEIPYAQIRHVFRSGVAEPMIDKLEQAQMQGQMMNGMAFASPQQIADSRSALEAGMGPMAAMLKLKGHAVTSAPGLSDADTGAAPDANDFIKRQKGLATFDTALAQRQTMIQKDPATYAAKEPGVAAAFAAAKASNDPKDLQAAIEQSKSVQRQVGVAPGDERTLGAGQAASMVKALQSMPSDKADVGAELDKMQAQYGAAYPGVIKDMTAAGLPPRYQLLAHANLPEQATVRSDAQTAFQEYDALKDKAQYGEAIPAAQKGRLEPAIDNALDKYRATIGASGGGPTTLSNTIYPGVKLLAQHYMLQGLDAEPAAAKAAGLINQSYSFDGTLRVPNGPGMPSVGEVRSSMQGLMSGLKDSDLESADAFNSRTSGMNRAAAISAPTTAAEARRSGVWFTNGDDTGATLMKGTSQGGYLPVRKADGSYLSVNFKSLPSAAYNARAGANDIGRAGFDVSGQNNPVETN